MNHEAATQARRLTIIPSRPDNAGIGEIIAAVLKQFGFADDDWVEVTVVSADPTAEAKAIAIFEAEAKAIEAEEKAAFDLRTPAKTASRKYTVQQINKLVENIRSGEALILPEREKHYHDPTMRGFFIRLLPSGEASWVLQYKQFGRQKKNTIGDVKTFDRQDAIKEARKLRAKVELDRLDPQEARRERMRANKVTFATLVPLFIEYKKNHKQLRPSTENIWRTYLTGYHFQPLHNHPIDEITSEQLETRLDDIVARSGNQSARNCHTVMRVFFKWAIQTGKLPRGYHNPMLDVPRPATRPSRKRVLIDDEIQLIWKMLDDWEVQAIRQKKTGPVPPKTKQTTEQWWNPNNADFPRAIKLLFLTGCRRREIGELRWSEINLDKAELFIPGKRRKSRENKEEEQDLFVPLADEAVRILRQIPKRPDNDFVFGGRKTIFGINLVGVRDRINQRIAKAGHTPLPDWRLHDIRRTLRTKMSQLKVTPDIAERLVGHVGHRTEMQTVYDQHEYWKTM